MTLPTERDGLLQVVARCHVRGYANDRRLRYANQRRGQGNLTNLDEGADRHQSLAGRDPFGHQALYRVDMAGSQYDRHFLIDRLEHRGQRTARPRFQVSGNDLRTYSVAVQHVSLEAQLIGGDGGRIRALHVDQFGPGFQAR